MIHDILPPIHTLWNYDALEGGAERFRDLLPKAEAAGEICNWVTGNLVSGYCMKRLIELYPIGTAVKILSADGEWVNGRVVAHQHPAVWVQTANGQQWFVTNRRRIKLAEEG